VVERHLYTLSQEHFGRFRFSRMTARQHGVLMGKIGILTALSHMISHRPQKTMAVSDGFWACRECSVVGESAHFGRSSSEAFARLIDRLALCIARFKRGASAGAPEARAP
jgi:hypothetical protein